MTADQKETLWFPIAKKVFGDMIPVIKEAWADRRLGDLATYLVGLAVIGVPMVLIGDTVATFENIIEGGVQGLNNLGKRSKS